MKSLKLSEIAKATNGCYNKEVQITSVVIDTRKVKKGSLFICIIGQRFDAHQFIDEAFKRGAAAVMISKDIELDRPFVKVCDTGVAMLALAGYYRSLFNIPVVALTGSVGKTTTKEFINLVLSSQFNTVKTQGNLNNEIGLPQTIFNFDEKTEAAVIEMGMNHFGEIHRLSLATKPTLAVITNVGVSHIENLGSRDGILKAKLEILDGLQKGAPLLLNADNDKLSTVKSDDYKIYRFAFENDADFRAVNVKETNVSTMFTVQYFGKEQEITIPTIGIHNVYNALAAFAVGVLLNIDAEKSALALSKYEPEGMRQKVVNANGVTVIEDCYNASPDSMRAAIATLSSMNANKKIAVLSDMLELGDYSQRAHFSVGKAFEGTGIDAVFCVGNDAKYIVDGAKEAGVKNAALAKDKAELADIIFNFTNKGDAILFKASRGMKLEDVITSLYKRWGFYE